MSFAYRKNPKNKFGAKRVPCTCPIGTHPSKGERATCQIMELRQRAGEIRDIKRQSSVRLLPHMTWKVDFGFTYCATGSPGWAEYKGKWDRGSAEKKKVWRSEGPGPLEIWMGHYRRPILVETIIPEIEA